MEINKFDEMVNKIKQCAFTHTIFDGGYDENENVFKPRETTQVVRLDTVIEILNEYIGGWILTSNQLPENNTYVLTVIQIPNRELKVRSGFYHKGYFHNDNGDTWNKDDIEVVAWMPLPKPYKVESEE